MKSGLPRQRFNSGVRRTRETPNSHRSTRSTQQARGHGSGCLSHRLDLHGLDVARTHCHCTRRFRSLTHFHSLTHSSLTSLTRFRPIIGVSSDPCTSRWSVQVHANDRHVPWTSSPASRSHEMSHTHIGFRDILDPPSTARRVGWCAAASPASCRRLHDAAQARGSHRFATPSQNGSRMAQARPAADPGRRSADTRGRRPR